MRKRKKFHELRYPKRRLSKGRRSAEQTHGTVLPFPAKSEYTSDSIQFPDRTAEDVEINDSELLRVMRINSVNAPDREDVIEVKNAREHYDGSRTGWKMEDSLIILTDVETGFFRECVEKDGGGWYGYPNRRHLERYGLSPYEFNKRKFRQEHVPVVEQRERENLVVRLTYRKAYHRATANIPALGKSAEILIQECWFKSYLPWPCLERDVTRSVKVANDILQQLEPEIRAQAKIVQPNIIAEMRLRRASGQCNLARLLLVPDGVPQWTALPVPCNRDELNGLKAFYEEDRAANRPVTEKTMAMIREK